MIQFNEIKQYETKLIEMRRYLHMHPELSNQETNTLEFIKKTLNSFDIETVHVSQAGILGFIHGKQNGKYVLLRADIDALPIEESDTNSLGKPKTCISLTKGVQHACGHDAHTAMLLVASEILQAHHDTFDGTVIVLFEQGEETSINIYPFLKYFQDNHIHIDACFGMHTSPYYETGKMMVQSGPVMAGNMKFKVELIGEGGHGSRPDLVNNPIDCFHAIYSHLNNLRMKYINPFTPLTFSIGQLQSGEQMNVIPGKLKFAGTVRFFDLKEATIFRNKMKEIIDKTSELYGCKVHYEQYSDLGLPLINDDECIQVLKKVLSSETLQSDIIEGSPWMGTETFAHYLRVIPGCFLFLSTNNKEKGILADIHNSKHDIEESVLIKGVYAHVNYALDILKSDTILSQKEDIEDLEIFYQKAF